MIAPGAGITIGAPWIGFTDVKVFAPAGIVAGCSLDRTGRTVRRLPGESALGLVELFQSWIEEPTMPDLTALHEALAGVVLGGRDLTEVLTEITGIARRAMPGSEASSITLIRGEKPFTAAFDGQMAMDADELQYQRGYGPCVDAGRAGQVFLVEDMLAEQRWPDYARHVAALGVRSSLSVPLPFQGVTIGALNNYAATPGAFGQTDVAVGQEVAAWVALAVGKADMIARTVDDSGRHAGGDGVPGGDRAGQGHPDGTTEAH